jgi:hypothetical protein
MTNEELGNWLAEMENRVSFLESSLPGSALSYTPPEEEPKPIKNEPWTANQWDIINQLRGEMAFLRNKVNEIADKRRGKSKYE